jgi:hypothetical protein
LATLTGCGHLLIVVAAAHGRSDAAGHPQPKYPPRTEHRPAIAVLDVFIVARTRPDGLVGLLVTKSSEPDFVNQLTVEGPQQDRREHDHLPGTCPPHLAGDDQQPSGYVLRLP